MVSRAGRSIGWAGRQCGSGHVQVIKADWGQTTARMITLQINWTHKRFGFGLLRKQNQSSVHKGPSKKFLGFLFAYQIIKLFIIGLWDTFW